MTVPKLLSYTLHSIVKTFRSPVTVSVVFIQSMARTVCSCHYEMCFQIKFKTAVKGHHVYKETWTPALGEILRSENDSRVEALV